MAQNGLIGTYYNNPTRSGTPVLTRTDANVNFDWNAEWNPGQPPAPVNPTNFSVRWTGQLQAPVTGTYTFSTNADDAACLWINNQLVLTDILWNQPAKTQAIDLQQGQFYDVVLDYMQATGSGRTYLSWTYPGQQQQIIPSSALFPTQKGTETMTTGLKGEYYNYQKNPQSDTDATAAFNGPVVYTRIDPQINFTSGPWNDKNFGVLPLPLNHDYFAIRWTGQVRAPATGSYQFRATIDDSIRLWVNNQPVMDRWRWDGNSTVTTSPIALVAGNWYPLKLEYAQTFGDKYMTLTWGLIPQGATQPSDWRVIPTECFSPAL